MSDKEKSEVISSDAETVVIRKKYVINQRCCFAIGSVKIQPEIGAFSVDDIVKKHGLAKYRVEQALQNLKKEGILNVIDVRDNQVVPTAVEPTTPPPEPPPAMIWNIPAEKLEGKSLKELNSAIATTAANAGIEPPKAFTNKASAIEFLGKDLPKD